MLLRVPDTRYARCDDLSIAYQVYGDGPVEILFAGSFVSHIELMWGSPEIKWFFDAMGSFARVAIFDKAGVGLSDPVPQVRTLEDRVRELEAVQDAAGFARAAVVGISEGGPAAVLYAASKPERVQSLVLMGTYALVQASWDDLELSAPVVRRRYVELLGEPYAPTEEQIDRIRHFGAAVRDDWGSGTALGILVPSIRSKQQCGLLERMSASPGMARATAEAAMRIDVRDVLPTLSVPTLVIHATDDPVCPIQQGHYLADNISGSRWLEVVGTDHAPWFNDPERILREIEEFLTGAHHVATARRALRTVLYTDVVGSTERAAALGDDRWHSLLEQLDAATRQAVERAGGQIVKGTGDGHLATLDGPAAAIRCAEEVRRLTATLGIEVRAGVHTGECELIGDDIGGLAVHIGARVCAAADAGEILVSSTVRDLVVGSGLGFDDRGVHQLKGVPGEWQLLAVRREGPPAGSPEATLVALPTPAPVMRRSDRAIAAVARRAPVLIRALNRVAP
jgi:pimeloyl-ACP methyl ester carboxylesterase